MELYQRKFFNKKHLVINEDTLSVEISSPFNAFEIDIPFEDIMVERIVRHTKIVWELLFFSCLFGLPFLALFICEAFITPTKAGWETIFILSVPTTFFTYFTVKTAKNDYIIPLVDHEPIVISRTIPNKEYVRHFASTLNNKVRAYLTYKYIDAPTDPDTKEQTLYWLFQRGIIKQKRYEEELQKLNSTLHQD